MGIKKRVSALLLAIMLSFGVCAVDYLKVDALEVGGSVVWDTAINYLLGLLGLSPIAENGDKIVDFDAMRSKWVQDYEAYFYANVQPEDLPEGYTKERAYQNWIDNVCRGNLNTVEYGAWDIFKEWAETLPSESSGGGSGGDTVISDNLALVQSVFPNVTSLPSYIIDYNVKYAFYTVNTSGTNYAYSIRLFDDNFQVLSRSNNQLTFISKDGGAHTYYYNYGTALKNDYTLSWTSINNDGLNISSETNREVYVLNYDISQISGALNFHVWDFSSSGTTTSDYAVVNDKITDLQIINDYSTTTTQNVVSIDWDKIGAMISDAVGTVTGSLDRTISDALDDAQEKVAAGTMSVANYNDYVTEISNTYVYDITNETSITNPDSTVTGIITGNVENAEFVLKGLQYVFPFCIPWDIKDFVTLLVADPVAPVIEYPIYNPVTDTDETITIDFSLWENQVRVIRYIFDFLLIIGLLLLARSLIGAGGSD